MLVETRCASCTQADHRAHSLYPARTGFGCAVRGLQRKECLEVLQETPRAGLQVCHCALRGAPGAGTRSETGIFWRNFLKKSCRTNCGNHLQGSVQVLLKRGVWHLRGSMCLGCPWRASSVRGAFSRGHLPGSLKGAPANRSCTRGGAGVCQPPEGHASAADSGVEGSSIFPSEFELSYSLLSQI